MKALVLGGNGFLGRHLIDVLLEDNVHVTSFDRYSSEIGHTKSNPNLKILKGDFSNTSDLSNALTNIEYVFHFIWLSTPASSADNPYSEIELNVKTSIQLLELAVKKGVKKIIFPSSGGTVYGNQYLSNPIKENAPLLPFSPYGIAKSSIERYLEYYNKRYNLEYLIFRIGNPYGQGQSYGLKQGILPIFYNNLKRNIPLTIYGDQNNARDYIHIYDAIYAMNEIFKNCLNSSKDIFNIGSGQGTSIKLIIQYLENLLQITATVNHLPPRPFDVSSVVLDIEKQVSISKRIPLIITEAIDKWGMSLFN